MSVKYWCCEILWNPTSRLDWDCVGGEISGRIKNQTLKTDTLQRMTNFSNVEVNFSCLNLLKIGFQGTVWFYFLVTLSRSPRLLSNEKEVIWNVFRSSTDVKIKNQVPMSLGIQKVQQNHQPLNKLRWYHTLSEECVWKKLPSHTASNYIFRSSGFRNLFLKRDVSVKFCTLFLQTFSKKRSFLPFHFAVWQAITVTLSFHIPQGFFWNIPELGSTISWLLLTTCILLKSIVVVQVHL